MGLQVKIKDDLYQLIDTSSDERLHDKKWVTKDEARTVLIERAYGDFVRKTIEIYMDFPNGYGNLRLKERVGCQWIMDNWDKIDDKFDDICKELNIKL